MAFAINAIVAVPPTDVSRYSSTGGYIVSNGGIIVTRIMLTHTLVQLRIVLAALMRCACSLTQWGTRVTLFKDVVIGRKSPPTLIVLHVVV